MDPMTPLVTWTILGLLLVVAGVFLRAAITGQAAPEPQEAGQSRSAGNPADESAHVVVDVTNLRVITPGTVRASTRRRACSPRAIGREARPGEVHDL